MTFGESKRVIIYMLKVICFTLDHISGVKSNYVPHFIPKASISLGLIYMHCLLICFYKKLDIYMHVLGNNFFINVPIKSREKLIAALRYTVVY